MMLRQGFRRYLVLILAAQALVFASAQEASFTTAGDALQGPEQLSAGYHEFTVANEGEQGYNVIVLRLKEGATQEALIPAVEAVDQAFAGEGDTVEAFNTVLELAEVYGEVFAEGTAAGRVGMVLEPGSYVLVGSLRTEEHQITHQP